MNKYIGKGIASVGICVLGGYALYLTEGSTGMMWAILGIFIIWGL